MRKKSLHEGSRAVDLLVELGNTLEDIHFGLSRPSLVVRFGMEDAKKYWNRKDGYLRRQEMQRLEQRDLIRVREAAGELEIKFLTDGVNEYFKHSLIQSEILPKGRYCMVTFDIPETEATLRKRLRELLKRSAFIPMQRSVWISNIDAAKTLSRLFKTELNKKWIRVFIAKEY